MSTNNYGYKTCPECLKTHQNRGETCSSGCAAKQRAKTFGGIVLTCELCGKQFTNKVGRGKYCQDAHYKKCLVCEKDFPIKKGKEAKENPTCGAKCGAVYSHRNPESKEKRKENSLKKWGVEHPFQAVEVKEKIEKSLEGTAGRFGTDASKAAIKAIYGVENVSSLDFVKDAKAASFKEHYLDKGILPYGRGPISKTNIRWKELLEKETGLMWEYERYFSGVGALDLSTEINGKIIAVEINPTATHNSYKNLLACSMRKCDSFPCEKHSKGKHYHYEKSKLLKENYGVTLINVFDWMDEDRVLSFVRSKTKNDNRKIYARKTKVITLTQTEANKFLKKYHMFGGSRMQTHCYGLLYDGELVQVQTYSKLKEKDKEFEARRLATKDDCFVVGGVSKITKHFIKEVSPDRIVAFSDLNLSWPDFDLTHNGFRRVGVNPPQKCWSKGDKMILDKSAAWQSADRLIGIAPNSKQSKYPEYWSNEQVFIAERWLPVWDCGMVKDEWRKHWEDEEIQ